MKRSAYVVAAVLIILAVALVITVLPFIVYLIYAMICKGPDCFP